MYHLAFDTPALSAVTLERANSRFAALVFARTGRLFERPHVLHGCLDGENSLFWTYCCRHDLHVCGKHPPTTVPADRLISGLKFIVNHSFLRYVLVGLEAALKATKYDVICKQTSTRV